MKVLNGFVQTSRHAGKDPTALKILKKELCAAFPLGPG